MGERELIKKINVVIIRFELTTSRVHNHCADIMIQLLIIIFEVLSQITVEFYSNIFHDRF
jgi:hypothetical protein